MCPNIIQPRLKIYLRIEEKIAELFEENGLTYASARQFAKLGKAILRGAKKSISSLHRLYFPEFSVESILKKIRNLERQFKSINKNFLERIHSFWDKRKALFLICDDFLIPRYGKKLYRAGKFRDPVKKQIGFGHNVVDTIITDGNLEMTFDFTVQPKGGKVPKTKKALKQLTEGLSFLRKQGHPKLRIRVLMDGGYTYATVLLPLKEKGVKYIGTIRRNKIFDLFGKANQLQRHFSGDPQHYRILGGKYYYYEMKQLNLKDLGMHKVMEIRRPGEKKAKYFITNDLKMTPFTFLSLLHNRWWVEQNHRDLKQFCGLKHMFVRTKGSVTGYISFCYLLKNILGLLLDEQGISYREYPIETLIEKEFSQVDQFLINSALENGILEEMNMI